MQTRVHNDTGVRTSIGPAQHRGDCTVPAGHAHVLAIAYEQAGDCGYFET